MNFALIMLGLLVLTGGVWLIDLVWLRRPRQATIRAAVAEVEPQLRRRPEESEEQFGARRGQALQDIAQKVGREPWWVEYSKSFFPVILLVFVLRSFLIEPFKIPSGSMIPTLQIGDFILVNKYTYGIRLPVINLKVLDVNQPKRGEVMVFRYPENPSLDYIKRVVGAPGDRISYRDKRLTVNGESVPVSPDGRYQYPDGGLSVVSAERFREQLSGHAHDILINPDTPAVNLVSVRQFPHRENCEYNETGFACTVPPGHYFMMGDNRDSSSDSRYWGFVPERNIVGKAFMIWWNFGDFGRVGQRIH